MTCCPRILGETFRSVCISSGAMTSWRRGLTRCGEGLDWAAGPACFEEERVRRFGLWVLRVASRAGWWVCRCRRLLWCPGRRPRLALSGRLAVRALPVRGACGILRLPQLRGVRRSFLYRVRPAGIEPATFRSGGKRGVGHLPPPVDKTLPNAGLRPSVALVSTGSDARSFCNDFADTNGHQRIEGPLVSPGGKHGLEWFGWSARWRRLGSWRGCSLSLRGWSRSRSPSSLQVCCSSGRRRVCPYRAVTPAPRARMVRSRRQTPRGGPARA